MMGLRKFEIPPALAVLVFSLMLFGCNGGRTDVEQGAGVSSEKRKGELEEELRRRFENPAAHFELGRLYQSEGLWAQAGYHYNVVVSFVPSHRRAQAGIVKVLLDSGDAAMAAASAEKYIKQVEGSTGELLELGKAFSGQQLDAYALACYTRALGASPKSAEVHKEIGYYYLGKGNKQLAREYLSTSFQSDPTQADVATELGRLGIEVRIPKPVEPVGDQRKKTLEQPDKAGQ